jgi:hypothetical protein
MTGGDNELDGLNHDWLAAPMVLSTEWLRLSTLGGAMPAQKL